MIKIAVSILIVVVLSVLAEVVSPKLAGMLSGFPLGAAISLFFIGYEISPEFAARSAVYTMCGLVATQTFAYFYFLASRLTENWKKGWAIASSALAGVAGYLLVSGMIEDIDISIIWALFLPSAAIIGFSILLRNVRNVKIEKRVALSPAVLLARSSFAAIFIVLITSTAKLVGERWAGLFSAFPITMLPFVLIIHITYDAEHVHSVLKNVPRGIGSIVAYALLVWTAYPRCGIYAGTLLAYLAATLYLVAINLRGLWLSASQAHRLKTPQKS